jgi:ATP synthase protein I
MAEDEIDEAPKLPPDARLGSLDQRLERLQQAEEKRARRRLPDASYRAGHLVLSHLIGGPAG